VMVFDFGWADLGEEVRGHPSACLFVARCV
jgi:hypothetical protein